jgi:hypothetical protein
MSVLSNAHGQVVDESTPFVAALPSVGEDGRFDYFAQSFYANVGSVTKLGAWLRADSLGGEVQFAILANSLQGTPDINNVAYQSSLKFPTSQGGWVYDSVAFAPLIIGQIYWFAIDGHATIVGTGFSSVGISTTFPSTNQQMYGSTTGGQSWQVAIGNPMAFYVEGDTCSLNVEITGESNVLCPGDTLELQATTGFASYQWSTGATTSSILVDTVGSYSVTVSDQNFCLGTYTYYITAGQVSASLVDDDYFGCQGSPVQVSTFQTLANILWSNGATTYTTSFTTAGQQTVQAAGFGGCTSYDTFFVHLNPIPQVDLGPDTALCEGAILNLDAGPALAAYQWSSGENSRSITVNSSGTYFVLVTGGNGCTAQSAPIVVSFQPVPAIPLITYTLTGLSSTFAFEYTWLLDGDTLGC